MRGNSFNGYGKFAPILALAVVLQLLSCRPVPSKSVVADTITRYFESRGYVVEEMVVSGISSLPISQLKYMGTKGYTVRVEQMTLVFPKEMEGQKSYRKGERVTLKGTVVVREDPSNKGTWLVSFVSPDLVP